MAKSNASGKKGSKIKWVILLIIVAVAAAFVVMAVSSAKMMSGITMANTFNLEKKDIENKVSVSGIVESQTFKQVTSKLPAYSIEAVNVEVGDKVKAGDILATLNTDDLQDQILTQQTALDSSNVNIEYSLSDAEKRYKEAYEQINNGTYPEIRNAKLQLDNAEDVLAKARDKYEEQLDIQGSDRDSQIVNARKNVESAKTELQYAENDYKETKHDVENEDYADIKQLKDAYDDAKKEYDSRHSSIKSNELFKARQEYESALSNYTYLSSLATYDPTAVSASNITAAQTKLTETKETLAALEKKYDVETTEDVYDNALEAYTKAKADIDSANSLKLKNAERTLERAKSSLETAENGLKAVEEGNSTSIKSYKDAVDDARKNVDDARETYNLALRNADSTLASLKSAADREQILSGNDSQVINLQILKDKLNDCVITAPCDGTVTAVNAEEGGSSAGTLFIIEDLDNLKMTAQVKEYNVTEFISDMPVTVSIPSMRDKEFEGVVSKIAPTGTKGVNGKSDGTSSFEIEILIRDTADSGLLIGMTSKASAVTGSAENVFAVAYDAIIEDGDGTSYVYTYDELPNGNGTATARKIIVNTGFESDAEIEISADGLSEGMELISNAGDITDGAVILLSSAFGDALQSAAGGQQ